MKALMQIGYGDLRTNLDFLNIEKPKPSAKQVLIQVHYASLNPHDYKLVHGDFKRIEKLRFPTPTGSDFSGTVIEVGKDVHQYKGGDHVFGIGKGTFAEYCLAEPSALCLKPKNITFADISVCPLVGLTTIQAFKKGGGINNSHNILIHAGSGGIGSFAIQYAKLKGANVTTTTSAKNSHWVTALGADRSIDYHNEDYLKTCSDLDFVFDTLGGEYTFDAFKVIKNEGHIISLLPAEINSIVAKEVGLPWFLTLFIALKPSKIKALIKQTNAHYNYIMMKPNAQDLDEIATLISSKKIKPIIEKTYEFRDIIKAYEHIAKGHSKGKVAIQILQSK